MFADPDDPYVVLGVRHDAGTHEITAAFRERAKRLHPDVPLTGNVDAFIRVREAYQVLGDPARRAAYDEENASRPINPPQWYYDADLQPLRDAPFDEPHPWIAPPDIGFDPPAEPAPRWWGTLPPLGWVGVGAALLVTLSVGVTWLARRPASSTPMERPAEQVETKVPGQDAPANVTVNTFVPPPAAPRPAAPPPKVSAASATNQGVPPPPPSAIPTDFTYPKLDVSLAASHYVLPAGGAATLWRAGDGENMVAAGQLPPFTSVESLRLLPDRGFMQVRVPGGTQGFVLASRLAPGGPEQAHRAYCIQTAGGPPANGEMFAPPRTRGTGRISIRNNAETSLVAKIRDGKNQVAAEIFVAPHATAALEGMPPGLYRPEFASGDLWSRRCGIFVAGMRTVRADILDTLGPGASLSYELPFASQQGESEVPDSAFTAE